MNSGSSPKRFCAWALASSSILGSRCGPNATRCDPLLVGLVSVSNCTSSMCLWTNSGGASRPGTRSHPGTALRSGATTLTNGPPFSRRPMLPSSRCSTPHRAQTEPLLSRGAGWSPAGHGDMPGVPRIVGNGATRSRCDSRVLFQPPDRISQTNIRYAALRVEPPATVARIARVSGSRRRWWRSSPPGGRRSGRRYRPRRPGTQARPEVSRGC